MSRAGVVVVGDALMDRDVEGRVDRVCPDAPAVVLAEGSRRSRPGGAALAAALAARLAGADGPAVTLVSALGPDPAGRELAAMIAAAGVRLEPVAARGTTTEKIRLRSGGHTLLRLDRGDTRPAVDAAPGGLRDELDRASVVLVADYGRGVADHPQIRAALSGSGRPVVWDPHPRGDGPVPGCLVVTPNAGELLEAAASARRRATSPGPATSGPLAQLTTLARHARRRWDAASVAVTRGRDGVLFIGGDAGPPLVVPVPAVAGGDPCGAGDCFAASVAVRLATGALPSEAVTAAAADAARFVAAGGAAAYGDGAGAFPGGGGPAPGADPGRTIEQVRRAGGTVVAAGGCFDLLHAGHVSLLQAARALGDCLVVCLNSDRSVRRLKGPGRPLNSEADRVATLSALGCVDAVVVFDEATPEQAIRTLRPDVWVKGGDYDGRHLPEAEILAEWGGQTVVLPYLAGRSTTGIVQRAGHGRP